MLNCSVAYMKLKTKRRNKHKVKCWIGSKSSEYFP